MSPRPLPKNVSSVFGDNTKFQRPGMTFRYEWCKSKALILRKALSLRHYCCFSDCTSGAQPAIGTIRLELDALAFLDNGQVRNLARSARATGPLSVEVVRGHVSAEDFIALVALGAWDKTPVKRQELWSSCFDQRTGIVVPAKQASQHRFLGFLTDDVHPGVPRLDGAIAPGQLGALLRSETNTQPQRSVRRRSSRTIADKKTWTFAAPAPTHGGTDRKRKGGCAARIASPFFTLALLLKK